MTTKTHCEQCQIAQHSYLTGEYLPAKVAWVGLSAKATAKEVHKPLAAETNSGSIIQTIEKRVKSIFFHRTNLVKCAPLSTNKKTRYPTKSELECCFNTFSAEITAVNPQVVFLLGKIVADFIANKLGLGEYTLSSEYEYIPIQLDGTFFIPIHHPSYIRIYRYKTLPMYQNSIIHRIESLAV